MSSPRLSQAFIRLACLVAATLGLASCAELGAATRFAMAESDIRRLALWQPSRPSELIARDAQETRRIAGSKSLTGAGGEVDKVAVAQRPFFVESELGRAYLGADGPKAYARGAPAESCPLTGVALGAATLAAAADAALTQCLAARSSAEAACGCQLLAAGDGLFAAAEAFIHARAVSATLIALDRGAAQSLIAEERIDAEGAAADWAATDLARAGAARPERIEALASGARDLWLLSPRGPAAALAIHADGTATLTLVDGPANALTVAAEMDGRWRAEGFRRGRLAGVAYFEDPALGAIALLVGYEPAELLNRRDALIAAAKELR